MSFVTPSITHNKFASSNDPAIFTQSRKLLVAQNCTHSQVCLHCVPHTGTQTGKVRRSELSRRQCAWSEEQTIVIYVFGVTVSKISAVFTCYLSEHKRMFYNCMTNKQMHINKRVQSHIIIIILDQKVSVTTLTISERNPYT